MKENDKELLRKFLRKDYTPVEYERIQELLQLEDAQEFLKELTWEKWKKEPSPGNLQPSTVERIHHNLFKAIDNRRPGKFTTFFRYAAIFVGFLFVLGTGWLIVKWPAKHEVQVVQQGSDILPGNDKALLTLADGSVISLSDAENGKILEQDGLAVVKTADGEIVYNNEEDPNIMHTAYNTITTPNGGQYRITLPDGSKAWLNAASSLTYPVHFSEKERRVKMSGEVYFEIAKKTNRKKERVPFFVETDNQEVQVLGTQFNVTAYTDEVQTRTTLVEGSVLVTNMHDGQYVLLKPGQQAVLDEKFGVRSVDTEQQVAWKDGKFMFDEDNLGTILRQLSRWYDIEVDCPDHLEKRKFSGMISRSTPLSTTIKMIQSSREIKITVKGRRLIVSE